MSQSVNTSYAVIVLGDQETAALGDLAEKAADQGAVITEIFSFDRGEAAMHDDLSHVEAVLCALSRALATGTDIWVPFPLPDLGREEHFRRLSLVLQRHGLNVLIGRELEPCTIDGGINPIDFALRNEVKMVDELDHAAICAAGMTTLDAEIARELGAAAADPAHPIEVDERFYSTAEVARFFGRSVRWVYGAMRTGVFTLPMLRDMARACYRRGIISEHELLNLLSVLARAEGE